MNSQKCHVSVFLLQIQLEPVRELIFIANSQQPGRPECHAPPAQPAPATGRAARSETFLLKSSSVWLDLSGWVELTAISHKPKEQSACTV